MTNKPCTCAQTLASQPYNRVRAHARGQYRLSLCACARVCVRARACVCGVQPTKSNSLASGLEPVKCVNTHPASVSSGTVT